jgi:hypothetical protein
MAWNSQQINAGGLTNGSPTVTNPYVSVYNGQQHVGYRDAAGNIWDSYYRPDTGKWNLQQINNGGVTKGPVAVAGPFIGVYHDQQHFAYLDSAGNLWDSQYNGSSWSLQRINAGGNTSGRAAMVGTAASLVSIWTDPSNTQQHFTYLGNDNAIYDAFWNSNTNGWQLQKINAGGNTSGPPATSSPFGCVFHSQQHIGYQAASGDIYDSWYDGNGHWGLQKINNGGVSSGPAAAAGTYPYIWVDPSNTQQHFTYLGFDQAIYDVYWDSGKNSWTLQKLTTTASRTNGPPAASGPAACVFNQQQHIGYTDSAGAFWDAWYDGSGDWSLQEINNVVGVGQTSNEGVTNAPGAAAGTHPFIWVVDQQQHFTYADPSGKIYDAFWQTPSSGISLGSILGSLGGSIGGGEGEGGGSGYYSGGGGDDLATLKKPSR